MRAHSLATGAVRVRGGARFVLVAATIAGVLVGTSACSPVTKDLFPPVRPTPGASHTPVETRGPESEVVAAIGDCWQTTLDEMQNDAAWHGSDPVDCSESHQAYTFAVVDLATKFDGSWQNSESDDSLRSDVSDAAYKQCLAASKDVIGDLAWNEQLVSIYFFVAPVAKWAAGDRSVRCDLAQIATGSSTQAPELGNLPEDFDGFAALVRSTPQKFEVCVNVPDKTSTVGPLDADGAVFADCTMSPDWVLTAHGSIDAGASAPYPGEQSVAAQARQICKVDSLPKGDAWYDYYPLSGSWDGGDRYVGCWVSETQGSPA